MFGPIIPSGSPRIEPLRGKRALYKKYDNSVPFPVLISLLRGRPLTDCLACVFSQLVITQRRFRIFSRDFLTGSPPSSCCQPKPRPCHPHPGNTHQTKFLDAVRHPWLRRPPAWLSREPSQYSSSRWPPLAKRTTHRPFFLAVHVWAFLDISAGEALYPVAMLLAAAIVPLVPGAVSPLINPVPTGLAVNDRSSAFISGVLAPGRH